MRKQILDWIKIAVPTCAFIAFMFAVGGWANSLQESNQQLQKITEKQQTTIEHMTEQIETMSEHVTQLQEQIRFLMIRDGYDDPSNLKLKHHSYMVIPPEISRNRPTFDSAIPPSVAFHNGMN